MKRMSLIMIVFIALAAIFLPGMKETAPAGNKPGFGANDHTKNQKGGMALVGDHAIRDAAGRTVCTKEPFSRIISLYSAHTENLFSLGLSDEIIGVSRIDAELEPAAGKKTFSARNSPERFLAEKPDLVIVRPMLDYGYPRLMKQLERFGIQVVSLQPGDIDEMMTYWHILGRLAGREDDAQNMVARFQKGVAEARSVKADITQKKTVYFEAIHNRFKTFSPGSMPLFALACAGGKNAAQDARPSRGTNIADFGKEQILARGREIDVYLAQEGHMNRPSVAGIKNTPGFSVIRAVREGEVYLVDEAIVSRPTLRLLEGISTIGGILYPNHFTEETRKWIEKHADTQQRQ